MEPSPLGDAAKEPVSALAIPATRAGRSSSRRGGGSSDRPHLQIVRPTSGAAGTSVPAAIPEPAHPAGQATAPTEVPGATAVTTPASQPTATQLGICHRLRTVFYDLGLVDIVGGDWIQPAGEGFTVGDLSLRSADRLLHRLETLLGGSGHKNLFGSPSYVVDDPAVPPPAAADVYEQLRFF